jgi:hypothetical protein
VTGKEERHVPIPDRAGCSFLLDVQSREWTWCTPNDHLTTVAVIDPESGNVSSFETSISYIGGLIDFGGETWALTSAGPDAPAGLIKLGPDGPTSVVVGLAGVDPDWTVMTGDSLWIPSDGDGKLYRFDVRPVLDLK